MPRRSLTVPISLGDGVDPDLTTIEANWQRIEDAYGKSLLAEVREEILEATRTFLFFEPVERKAEPRKNAARWIKGCKKAAEELWQAMMHRASVADMFAQQCVAKNFPQGKEGFPALVSLLPSLNAACVSALEELKDASMPSFRPGRQWGRWVRRLTEIMRQNSLPSSVSKDPGRKSRFVELVWELQQLLPVGCWRHMQSKPALAKAILEERARPRRQATAKIDAAGD